MAHTDLSTLIAPPAEANVELIEPGSRPGAPIEDEVKLEAILSIAELMEKGTRSTIAIMGWLAGQGLPASRPTAIKYRNLATTLIARESKPMNRENMRALEQGRLMYWIERLTNKIKDYEDAIPAPASEDYLKWHDTYTKMLSKLNDFAARLHAITGLNELTINNNDHKSRIVFHFNGSKDTTDKANVPTSHNTSPSVRPIIEGEATPSQD